MRLYRDGRQIFEPPQEVHKRGGLKFKNRLIDKVLVQMSLLLLYQQDSGYGATFGGPFSTGAHLPQKLVLLPPLETQYISVQGHVSSY
jgi:hypothetical protein